VDQAIKTEGVGAHAERLIDKSVLTRYRRPEERAEVAAFVASNPASFVTRTAIVVVGGWTAKLA
jgi:NAD(P)-dependent dehydrogenase (short-subunit alcohol dehydrogenase family)